MVPGDPERRFRDGEEDAKRDSRWLGRTIILGTVCALAANGVRNSGATGAAGVLGSFFGGVVGIPVVVWLWSVILKHKAGAWLWTKRLVGAVLALVVALNVGVMWTIAGLLALIAWRLWQTKAHTIRLRGVLSSRERAYPDSRSWWTWRASIRCWRARTVAGVAKQSLGGPKGSVADACC